MDSGEAVDTGDKDKAGELLVSTSRKLDQAASKGVIHKNQAANRKSALASRVQQALSFKAQPQSATSSATLRTVDSSA